MPKIYPSKRVALDNTSQHKIDLGKILNLFENVQNSHLDYVSMHYFNPEINQNSSIINGGRFFKKQLSFIVEQSKPDGHFYWFKKLFSFYETPSHKEITLEKAIQEVLSTHVEPLKRAYLKIHSLYVSKMMTQDPIVKKLLKERNALYSKLENLNKIMPQELISIAIKLGADDMHTFDFTSDAKDDTKKAGASAGASSDTGSKKHSL